MPPGDSATASTATVPSRARASPSAPRAARPSDGREQGDLLRADVGAILENDVAGGDVLTCTTDALTPTGRAVYAHVRDAPVCRRHPDDGLGSGRYRRSRFNADRETGLHR